MKLQIRNPFEVDAGVRMALHMEGGGLEMNGKKYVPDKTKGYIEFHLAHGFPVVTSRGRTLDVGTVANSYESMRHQGLNFEHRVKSYERDPEKRRNAEDRYIGSIVDVEFPPSPYGGWSLEEMLSGKRPVPGIRGIAVLFKQANGVDRFLGEHQSGKHAWTVSLEVDFSLAESSVVLMPPAAQGAMKDRMPAEMIELAMASTPADWGKVGIYNIPVPDLPDDVVDAWSEEKEQFTKPVWGRQPVLMMGGLNKSVHFKGTGVVRYGAEPTAVMGQVLASDLEEERVGEAVAKIESALGKMEALMGTKGTQGTQGTN